MLGGQDLGPLRHWHTMFRKLAIGIPLDHQLQMCLGGLDLVLGLNIQHVSGVFAVDFQYDVARLEVCLFGLTALINLLKREMIPS